ASRIADLHDASHDRVDLAGVGEGAGLVECHRCVLAGLHDPGVEPGAGGGVRVVVDVHPCDGLSSIDRDRARLEAARVVIIDAHLDGPGGHGAQGVHVVVIAATSTATTSSTTVVVMIVIVVVVVIVTNDRR